MKKLQLQINGMYPDLYRAMEVALTAGLDIHLKQSPDYITPKRDIEAIKQWYKSNNRCHFGEDCPGGYVDDLPDGCLVVELPQVDFRSLWLDFELYDKMVKRVANARVLIDEVSDELDEGSIILLKNYYDRVNPGFKVMDTIVRSSRAIAALDGSKAIRTEHLAEAIQYQMYESETYKWLNQ